MMRLANLTPHDITLVCMDGAEVIIHPSGTVARCTVRRETVETVQVNGHLVPINRTRFGPVEGLPEPDGETWYIVSSIVAQAVPGREDVLIVDDTVRDASGRIVGAKALARV